MTPDRLGACLTIIGWSGRELGRRLGKDKQQVRRWLAGSHAVPQDVADWIERLACFHGLNPTPEATDQRDWPRISYRNASGGADTTRFVQFEKDRLPVWADDVKPHSTEREEHESGQP